MALQKDKEHVLSERLRQRILGIIKNDPAFGAIRGMIYNNLQQWKLQLFEANNKLRLLELDHHPDPEFIKGEKPYVAGEVYGFMRLTPADKEFMLEVMLDIDDMDVTDEFLLGIAQKTFNKLDAVKAPSEAQKNLKADMVEALSGEPF